MLRKIPVGGLVGANVAVGVIMIIAVALFAGAFISAFESIDDNSTEEEVNDAFFEAAKDSIPAVVVFSLGMLVALGVSIWVLLITYRNSEDIHKRLGDGDRWRVWFWVLVGVSLGTYALTALLLPFTLAMPVASVVFSLIMIPVGLFSFIAMLILYWQNMQAYKELRAREGLVASDAPTIAFVLVAIQFVVGVTGPIGQLVWALHWNGYVDQTQA